MKFKTLFLMPILSLWIVSSTHARYYDAQVGRFISPDTIVPNPHNPQSLNRYAYVSNNPLNYVDPSGYWRISFSFHFIVGGHFSYDSDNGQLRTGIGAGMGGGIGFGDDNWGLGFSNDNYFDIGYDNKLNTVYLTGQAGGGITGPGGVTNGLGIGGSSSYYFRQGEYQAGAGVGLFGFGANAGYSSFGEGNWNYGGTIAQLNATYDKGSKDWNYFYSVDNTEYKKRVSQRKYNGYGVTATNPIAKGFYKVVDWIGTMTAGFEPAESHDIRYQRRETNKTKADWALFTDMIKGSTSNMFNGPNNLFSSIGIAISPLYYGAVHFFGGPAYKATQNNHGK